MIVLTSLPPWYHLGMEENPYKAPAESDQVGSPMQAPLFTRRPVLFMQGVCAPCVAIGGIAGMWFANYFTGDSPANRLAVQMGWGLGAMGAGVPIIAYGFWRQHLWRKRNRT